MYFPKYAKKIQKISLGPTISKYLKFQLQAHSPTSIHPLHIFPK